jgi:DNA polymerase-3 subunit gamma/tau
MSYQVIARRWRPQAFDEVVGQRAITTTLKNALVADRLAHALLFAGPRGVGKTTTARIVAKALNCAQGPTPSPCGTCPSCQEIAAGRSVDCLEVDAASNTQVEKTRELLETVQYAPIRGRHKVYIIDEAHMLSVSSFNALLKTLEEPPARVVFILATTEPHRIPATIHSRCQRYDFRLLGAAEIAGRLREIVQAEGVQAEEGALAVLAQAAAGSLRDGQSLLDQVIASLGSELTAERVTGLLGLVRADVLVEAADAVLARDAGRAIRLVDRLASQGQDLRQFVLDLLGHLRDLAILQVCPEPGILLEASRVDLETCRRQAAQTSVLELEMMIRALQQAETDMRRVSQPRFLLEMALIRLTQMRQLRGLDEILSRLAALEGGLPGAPASGPAELPLFGPPGPAAPPAPPRSSAGAGDPPPRPTRAAAGEMPPPPPGPTQPASAAAPDLEVGWAGAVGRLRGRKRLASVLTEVRPVGLEGDVLTLEVANGNAFIRDTLEDGDARRLIADAVAASFAQRLRLEYRFVAAAAPHLGVVEPQRPAAGPPPARDHPLVREALAVFGGSIVRNGAGRGPVTPEDIP